MNTPHILVVDDEKEITDLIEIYLTQEGYQVEKRYNAFTLMNDILEYHIDVVILDIMMHVIDGIHDLQMIGEKYDVSVFFFSDESDDVGKLVRHVSGAYIV